jgi:hypothetical protein
MLNGYARLEGTATRQLDGQIRDAKPLDTRRRRTTSSRRISASVARLLRGLASRSCWNVSPCAACFSRVRRVRSPLGSAESFGIVLAAALLALHRARDLSLSPGRIAGAAASVAGRFGHGPILTKEVDF